MLKLFKYELKKQTLSKLIILIILGLFQVGFLIALALDKPLYQGAIAGIAAVFSYGALIYLGFEAIVTFSNDLKTKTSYMLFLTPTNSYQIVGAKLLSAAVQIILSAFAFFGIFVANGTLLVLRYDKMDEMLSMIKEAVLELTGIVIDYPLVISLVCIMIGGWLLIIVTSFLSITLSTTLLSNNKFKGLLSGGLFMALMLGVSKIIDIIDKSFNNGDISITENFVVAGYLAIVVVIFTIFTGWMLEKKVSV